MTIRLMIVDDEKRTRENIEKFIPWEKLGIGVIKTAKNGQSALEIAKTLKPDILLCDIFMPKVNGITLATEIRKLFPDCKIIFISGYSDKEYLKSAISLRAISYIEKPINLKNLTEVLEESVAAILKENKQTFESTILRNSIEASLPLVREEIVIGLVTKSIDKSTLTEKYSKTAYYWWPADGIFSAVCIILNCNSSVNVKTSEEYRHYIQQLFYNRSFNENLTFLAGVLRDNRVALITNIELSESSKTATEALEEIRMEILSLSKGNFSISIGVGTPTHDINAIDISYKNAELSALKQFYEGQNKIYYYSNDNKSSLFLDNNSLNKNLIIQDFKNLIQCSGKEQIISFLTDFFMDVNIHRYKNIASIKKVFYSLFLSLVEFQTEKNIETNDNLNDAAAIENLVADTCTLAQLQEHLINKYLEIFEIIEKKGTMSRTIYTVTRYIHQHYADKNLSVKEIADASFISVSYLCSLFKKETGLTVNDFTTQLRIEKAKELLKDSTCKLYEIASRVGFADPDYFTRLFKKYENYTPSEFRERNQL